MATRPTPTFPLCWSRQGVPTLRELRPSNTPRSSPGERGFSIMSKKPSTGGKEPGEGRRKGTALAFNTSLAYAANVCVRGRGFSILAAATLPAFPARTTRHIRGQRLPVPPRALLAAWFMHLSYESLDQGLPKNDVVTHNAVNRTNDRGVSLRPTADPARSLPLAHVERPRALLRTFLGG